MNKLPPRTHLPVDLVAELLSWLPVKSLMRLRCVCKSWNKLIISNHSFTKLHLHRSALRNPQLLLQCEADFCVTHLSGSGLGLPEDPWISLAHNPRHGLKEFDSYSVVGSCNGLICLKVFSSSSSIRREWLCFWNPATGLMSKKLLSFWATRNFSDYKLNFGYHDSTNTYKVVLFLILKLNRALHVKVFTLGCNGWRDIQKFPLLPFSYDHWGINDGVHLSGTINWMTSRDESARYYNPETITVEQLVIMSLDLGTETCTLLSPPQGLDEVPCVVPSVGVLMDCLCFSHDLNKTHFVIWQMNKFGDAKSWAQFLKISYQDLQINDHYLLFPLCFYNGDTLVLWKDHHQAILYNRSSNTVERLTTTNRKLIWYSAYVESLVSPTRRIKNGVMVKNAIGGTSKGHVVADLDKGKVVSKSIRRSTRMTKLPPRLRD